MNALSQAGHFSTDDSVVISVNKYIVVEIEANQFDPKPNNSQQRTN